MTDETRKLEEETRRLWAEASNLSAKRHLAELKRERWWHPLVAMLALFATSAAIAAVIAKLIH